MSNLYRTWNSYITLGVLVCSQRPDLKLSISHKELPLCNRNHTLLEASLSPVGLIKGYFSIHVRNSVHSWFSSLYHLPFHMFQDIYSYNFMLA